ncbi:hypothetical protein ACIPRD_19015 [Streptomyces sp. NPDC090108]|uniref:hypothetical protein n=1 Tax=Streptomyces sp. NPDC090108 TaxID=3365947 RepID=UPI0038233AE1
MSNFQQRIGDAWRFLTGTAVRKVITGIVAVLLGGSTLAVNWQTLFPEKSEPDRSISINTPADSSTISRCVEFVSGHGIIPTGQHLWVALMTGSSAEGEKRITLVGKGEAVQTSTKGMGQWKAVQVNVGGATRFNYHYRLFAILLSDEVNSIVVNSAVNVTDYDEKVTPVPGQARWRIEYADLPGRRSDPVEVIRNGKDEKVCEPRSS